MQEILKYFSREIKEEISKTLETDRDLTNEIEEIRVRVGRKILFKLRNRDICLEHIVTSEEILQLLEKICDNSIYAYKNQISQGYITIKGGHRVGIVGTCIIEENNIVNMKNITSMNFRIAREVKGASNKIIEQMINEKENRIYNTLIVSPPGKGKTTILRDLIRVLSNGLEHKISSKTIGVVDERGELAGAYRGRFENDIGEKTDVIENVTKEKGINILIRSMAPEIIVCDEIGSQEDIKAIKHAFSSGLYGIFTMHGRNMEDICKTQGIKEFIDNKVIEKIFFI